MNTELTQEVMDLVKKHKLLGSGSNEDFNLTDREAPHLGIEGLDLDIEIGSEYVYIELSSEEAIQVAVALLNNVIYPK